MTKKKKKHAGRHRPADNKPSLADIKTRLTNDAFQDDDDADTERFTTWTGPTTYLENK